jgi:hypothetical protein
MKNNWEEKAEQALESLNGLQRAVANPFLYTRIKARIEEQQNKWVRLAGFIGRPAIAITAAVFFIAINAWVVVKHPLSDTAAKPSAEAEQAFEPEYATLNYTLAEQNTNEK